MPIRLLRTEVIATMLIISSRRWGVQLLMPMPALFHQVLAYWLHDSTGRPYIPLHCYSVGYCL